MATTQIDDRLALIELLPRFLMRVLRGWSGMMPVLNSAGLDRPTSFLLRALVEERDAGEGITEAAMRADLFNPYSTIRPIVDTLPSLVEKGYVAHDGDGYVVTDIGRAVAARVKAARDIYLTSLMPIPTADLVRLVDHLMAIAGALRDAPEPTNKGHQARAWRAMSSADAAPMVRLVRRGLCSLDGAG